jgi:excisionase family DNA binding protein
MAMIRKRRIEVIAIACERTVRRPAVMICPACQSVSEMLTTRQAGLLLQVEASTIYRWLAQGKAHGVKTAGGQHRLCRNSLFYGGAPPKLAAIS